ncbi:hypothetical protein FB451DRAFT_776392 [Mycena latifolia]|nr:hypothetical protein FB451DRAFT_776392 [Mycena latifolia]
MSSAVPVDAASKGVRVLSLDGGGAGALSELLTLDKLMYRIRTKLGQETAYPCDYFELIGGSGTGGIIALMLGRRRMSVSDAISAYQKLKPQPKRGRGEAFRASNFEEVLKDIFAAEKLKDSHPKACKTVVCAMNKLNMNAGTPELFCSYDTPDEPANDCMIWEAARATSATPGLFKPISIGFKGMKQEYISGSVGHNNPTTLVLTEAGHIFSSRPVVLVVSIGSGHPDTIQILKSPSPSVFAQTMQSIITDCERTHEDNERRYWGTSNTYFRFNVQQGMQGLELQHWENLDQVSAHTEAYLRTEEAKSKLTGTSEVLLNPVIRNPHSPLHLKVCPPANFHFTGREDILGVMSKYFNTDIGRRHSFLLHGLGGVGKTQIALKFVEQSTTPEPRFTEVYFIDSSSQQTIESDLAAIAHVKGVGGTFQDTLLWLSNKHTEWLMVFNNADDVQLRLIQYFPSCSHGNIIITSRNRNLGQAAQAKVKVEGMQLNEATDLLLSTAGYDVREPEYRRIGQQIVQKLYCLALAVTHAGAYIFASCPLQKYLDLHESTTQRLRLLNQSPSQSDYELSVYATWHISFEKVSTLAKELLKLCSFIHHDGITEAIFEQAALYGFTSVGPTEMEMQEPLKFLAGFATPTSKWDSLKFIALTTELGAYSLIDLEAGTRVMTFSLHPLVHEWCRTTVKSDSSTELCMHQLVGMAISGSDDPLFNHLIFPHLDALFFTTTEGSVCQPNVRDLSFAQECLWAYDDEGKWDDGAELGHSMLRIASVEVTTLGIQSALARIYNGKGDFHHARVLGEAVLERAKILLGEDHQQTQRTMITLAITHDHLGDFQEANNLETTVLDKHRTLLGDDHPDTLKVMGNLAVTYRQLGEFMQAKDLEATVLDKRRTLLGKDHPDTLLAMGNLALTYRELGNFKQAKDLETMVLDKHRTLLGEDHPHTLLVMGNLAMTCWKLGQFKEAKDLETAVLDKRRTVLGKDHPHTLLAMGNLAMTHWKLGQFKEAKDLATTVLDKRRTLLGNEHPHTLIAMGNLAVTHRDLGQFDRAEDLGRKVLEKSQEVLGAEHPSTLRAMANLALTYYKIGRITEARELQEQALQTSRRVLGELHPDTQATAQELAATMQRLEGAGSD